MSTSGKDRFEDHLALVESVVRELESGNLPLEESIRKYELGKKALDQCYRILDSAERKIQELTRDEAGQAAAKPFDPVKSDDLEAPAKGPRKAARPADPSRRSADDESPF